MPTVGHAKVVHHFLLLLEVELLYHFVSPITQVELSTKPLMLNDTITSPLGLAVISPCVF